VGSLIADNVDGIGSFLKGAGWALLPLLLMPFLNLLFPKQKFLSSVSDALVRLIDTVNHKAGEIVKWALPIMVLTVAFGVFARSIFGLAWTKLFESAIYLHVSVIMLGAAATLLAGQHVRVDIFHVRMSRRKKALTDFCGFFLLMVPVCLIILWYTQPTLNNSWMDLETSPEADGIRGVFLLKTTISLFALMMLAQGLAIAIRAANVLSDKSEPERPTDIDPLFPDNESPS